MFGYFTSSISHIGKLMRVCENNSFMSLGFLSMLKFSCIFLFIQFEGLGGSKVRIGCHLHNSCSHSWGTKRVSKPLDFVFIVPNRAFYFYFLWSANVAIWSVTVVLQISTFIYILDRKYHISHIHNSLFIHNMAISSMIFFLIWNFLTKSFTIICHFLAKLFFLVQFNTIPPMKNTLPLTNPRC